jgi:hypothetical protein
MATALKQLPSAIDQIPMPDVWELFEHWQQWPPEFVLLRIVARYEPQKVAKTVEEKAAGLAQTFGAAQRAPSHIKDLVKWAEAMKQKFGVNLGNA